MRVYEAGEIVEVRVKNTWVPAVVVRHNDSVTFFFVDDDFQARGKVEMAAGDRIRPLSPHVKIGRAAKRRVDAKRLDGR